MKTKIKLTKKKIIIILIVIFVLLFFYFFFGNKKENNVFFDVVYSDIKKDIFESGVLKKGEEINLGFKTGGKIGDIYVKIGEYVKEGDILGKLDNDELKLQLSKARNNLEMANINLSKMERGFTEEEVNNYEIAFKKAEDSFKNSENNLFDLERSLRSQIKDTYSKVDDIIGSKIDKFFINPKSYNANFEVSIDNGGTLYYFPVSQDERNIVNNGKIRTEDNLKKIKEISTKEDSIEYIKEVENYLKDIISFLDNIASLMNSFSTYDLYYESILTQYKQDISSSRSSVSLVLSSLYTSLNAYNSAVSSYDLSKGNLEQAKSQLNIIVNGTREEDIEIQKSTINQIKTEIEIISNYIEDSSIRALRDGMITDIKKKKGEIIQPGEPLFSFLEENSYQVEVNIYEGEIARISIKDKVQIELVAFPYQKFQGEVISIEPVGRIIDGVVYYKTIIYAYDVIDKAMSGMTADIIITTLEKENVLVVSENTLNRINNKVFVNVLEGKELKEKEIEVGVRGDGRIVEVISGLKEGDKVLVK